MVLSLCIVPSVSLCPLWFADFVLDDFLCEALRPLRFNPPNTN